ncbi:MAG: hypothetical protein K1X57_14615 [Gemmataceae bacterium]|nr:hypothetical protein [Gemmataceae bacterium]
MSHPEFEAELETDSRFPSGKWIGFYLMAETGSKRHPQELILTFRNGRMSGEGQDTVGKFVIEGKYTTDDGKAHWVKTYIGRHYVLYNGYNEGKGIWGMWEIPPGCKGGFHIWPEGHGIGSNDSLKESVPLPLEQEDPTLMPV